jgi:hypothetical protein
MVKLEMQQSKGSYTETRMARRNLNLENNQEINMHVVIMELKGRESRTMVLRWLIS